jgi:uncharacterized membrane protein
MTENKLERAIATQSALDPVIDKVQPLLKRLFDANPRLAGILHGEWLGHPLHPAVVAIPIGAWTVTQLLDAIDIARGAPRSYWFSTEKRAMRKAADISAAVGLGGALIAALPGVADYSKVRGPARRLGLVHGLTNLGIAGLYAASLSCRRADRRGAGVLLSTLGFGLAMFSGWLGGEMIYRHGVGVSAEEAKKAAPAEASPYPSVPYPS